MTPITTDLMHARAHTTSVDAAYRLLGLAIITLFPALFWTAVLALIGYAIGHPVSLAALVTFGAAIATFLFTATALLFRQTS